MSNATWNPEENPYCEAAKPMTEDEMKVFMEEAYKIPNAQGVAVVSQQTKDAINNIFNKGEA